MIIILAPELAALQSKVSALPPLLKKFFARSRSRPLDPNGFLSDLVTGQPVAAAPIERLKDRPDDCEGFWAFAEAINLRPDLSAVWIQSTRMGVPEHPALAELRSLFSDANLALEMHGSERAYLRLNGHPDASFTPPWGLAGQSMDYVFPSGQSASKWIALLTECQVLLHQHKQDDAQLPSGLWFWGAGELPATTPDARVSHLIGSEFGLSGLANWLQLSHSPEESGTPDGTLRVWPIEVEQSADEVILQLADLIRPLWRRLLLGQTDVLELASRENVWRVSTADARRFWRRN